VEGGGRNGRFGGGGKKGIRNERQRWRN